MTESTKQHWDTFWLLDSGHTEPNHKLVKSVLSLGSPYGWKTLEVGAGRGADSIFLAQNGAESYVLDYSQEALKMSEALASQAGIELNLVKADAFALPFEEGTFDLVFHQGFLEHFHDPHIILEEQRRVLKTGGHILVDVPQKYSLYTLRKQIAIRRGTWFAGWETQYSLRQLEKIMERSGFSVVNTYAWGMAASYGWGVRNALHWIKRISSRSGEANDDGDSNKTGVENNMKSSLFISRVLPYLADNIGVIGQK